MTDDGKDWLTGSLQPEERILWTGRPDARHYALAKGLYPSVLAVTVIIVALMAWQEGRAEERLFVSVASFLLVFAGLVMLISPAWHWFLARYVRYAVTDQRAVIFRSQPAPLMASYPPDRIDHIDLQHHKGGLGSVRFPGEPRNRKLGWAPGPADGFFGIAEADLVARLLRDLKKEKD